MLTEKLTIKNLEDVITANENYIKAKIIRFPLMQLKMATSFGYSKLGFHTFIEHLLHDELKFKNQWCCFAHYYLYLLIKALNNKGYTAKGVIPSKKISGSLHNKLFTKSDGKIVYIDAIAGM
jgi:hypothetical protein